MRLTGREGNVIAVAVTGYQFPDGHDPARRFSWHMVAGRATRGHDTWEFRYAALSCDESPQVSRWLMAVAEWADAAHADRMEKRSPAPLTFTEPNLSLRTAEMPEPGWVTLVVDLRQEFQAPSERRRGGTSTLTVTTTPTELRSAADQWDRELAPYPDGPA